MSSAFGIQRSRSRLHVGPKILEVSAPRVVGVVREPVDRRQLAAVADGDTFPVKQLQDAGAQNSQARRAWDAVKAIAVDYYYFLALIAFFVVMWPVLAACHYIDQRCGTHSTEPLVRFCERF
jgi:hypothetical protein